MFQLDSLDDFRMKELELPVKSNIPSKSPVQNDELFNAAHAGDLEKVKQLIESGADPNSVDANGAGTLLNFHPEVIRYLLSKGADPDIQRNENILPVLVGVAGINMECVKVMLASFTDVSGHVKAACISVLIYKTVLTFVVLSGVHLGAE